tara:strand:- start:862 stop:1344 length:483 start_codon:yes stop_codon:yes gene_type:complete
MEKKYCKQLITQVINDSALHWKEYDEPHKKHIKAEIHHNSDYGPTQHYKWFIELLKKDVKKLNPNYEISDWVSFMVYKRGDYFKPHTDQSSYDAYLSAGYLLNQDFDGGDYIIKGNTLNNIEIGELFTFSRTDIHEVTQITKGNRYAIHFAILNTKKSII